MAFYRLSGNKFYKEAESLTEIFSEFDFEESADDCDFFCPECRNMLNCVTYKEIKTEWDSIYM